MPFFNTLQVSKSVDEIPRFDESNENYCDAVCYSVQSEVLT